MERISLFVGNEVLAELHDLAQRRGRSVSELVRQAVDDLLARAAAQPARRKRRVRRQGGKKR